MLDTVFMMVLRLSVLTPCAADRTAFERGEASRLAGVVLTTEVDVLRGLGVDPTLGALRRRRRVVLAYVRDAAS